MTFRDFMALALYEPREGYYMSRRLKLGREGDFLTSPEVHPAFGVCVARAILGVWKAVGWAGPITIIEPGAGSGAMAEAILSYIGDAWPGDVDYRIVETSAGLIERQQERLEAWGRSVRWADWDDVRAPADAAFVVSNELFDSLPVHRVVIQGGRLREVYVMEQAGELVEVASDASTPEIARYFEDAGVTPGEGCSAEVNLEAPRLLQTLAGSFERGVMLSFDYGHEADVLYAPWRTQGTLLCYYGHAANTDPYRRVGKQDITSHVDWTSLRRAGEAARLATAFLLPQAEFLAALGIGEWLSGEQCGRDLEEFFARRRGISELIDPEGLGRIRVLAQYRGDARLGEALRRLAGLEAESG
jgi:SAM-dependent MidA family methyltransferase